MERAERGRERERERERREGWVVDTEVLGKKYQRGIFLMLFIHD